MKNLLNNANLNKSEKLNNFKIYTQKFTSCYSFKDIYISENREWSVLYFNGLYKLTIDEKHVCIEKSSGMSGCDWTKQFKKSDLAEIVNFIATELNIYPIN